MEYNSVLRDNNFLTDLLADKMDVIRRKATMYESMGDVEAASKMQEIFHLLKRMYDVSGKEKLRILARQGSGDELPWESAREVQEAMDLADEAMAQLGRSAMSNAAQRQAAALQEVDRLKVQIQGLEAAMEQTLKRERSSSSEKSHTISRLNEQILELERVKASLENKGEMYKQQIAALRKENLAHIASLEAKINSQVSRIQELEALGLEATKQQLEEAKATAINLLSEKEACEASLESRKHQINIDPEVEREALVLEIARRDEVIRKLTRQAQESQGRSLTVLSVSTAIVILSLTAYIFFMRK